MREPISTAPPDTRVLLWVPGAAQRPRKGAWVPGRVFEHLDGSRTAIADGYHGDWGVTMWTHFPADPE